MTKIEGEGKLLRIFIGGPLLVLYEECNILPEFLLEIGEDDLAPLGLNADDESFCKRLVVEHRVAAIPVSAFYAADPIRSVVRFCFAKRDQTLDAALDRLAGALKRAA